MTISHRNPSRIWVAMNTKLARIAKAPIMRVGGSLTALALGGFLGAFWLRQARQRHSPARALAAKEPASKKLAGPDRSSLPRSGDIGS